jgi:beta-glucosidase
MPAFPAGFLWGTATASYQIEGAVDEDGRGRSVWDTFCAQPGKVDGGDTGDVACDHYHRWPQDVALMAELGANAYRFSIAWPRVQPGGRGPTNPKGLAFYDRLVDALCERGIAPVATLFHWDTPQEVEDEGGWLARSTAERFAEYAAVVADALGDRVRHWVTLNEPIVHLVLGYATGMHAPGRMLLTGALPAAHTLLLGHGLAVQALRAAGATSVGITNNYSPAWPATTSSADVAAAQAFDALFNRLFTEPLLTGRYPGGLDALAGAGLPELAGPELAAVTAPLDFLGVNYYSPQSLSAPPAGSPLPFELGAVEGYPTTACGWPVVPAGLGETLVDLALRYRERLPPIFITENGCAYDDVPGPDGAVDDPDRIAYLDGHLRALHAVMSAGVDVRGYFLWSLLDNFEWAQGYSKRFGLVHVDYRTQARIPKASFRWYRDVITRRDYHGRGGQH